MHTLNGEPVCARVWDSDEAVTADADAARCDLVRAGWMPVGTLFDFRADRNRTCALALRRRAPHPVAIHCPRRYISATVLAGRRDRGVPGVFKR